jgi:hypothetical protein
MNDREIVVQFLAGARDFLFSKTSELTLGDHPISCLMGVRGSFPRSKVTGDDLILTFTTLLSFFILFIYSFEMCALFLVGDLQRPSL